MTLVGQLAFPFTVGEPVSPTVFGRVHRRKTVTERAKSARRLARLEPDEIVQHLRSRYMRALEKYVRGKLHGAQSPAELEEAVDAVLEDEQFHALQADLRSLMTPRSVAEVAEGSGSPPDVLIDAAGSANRTLVDTAWELEAAVAHGWIQVFALLSKRGKPTDATAPQAPPPPLYYLTDPRVPTAVKRGLLGNDRAEVFVIGVGASCGHPVPPWMMRQMLDGWITGRRRYLEVLAAFPIEVPATLIPPGERLSLEAINRDHALAEQGYKERLDKARASNLEVYPPIVGEPVDG